MDGELEAQLTDVMSRFNGAAATLRLFTDADVDPEDEANPEKTAADFTEPALTGYAAVSLDGLWTAPARDEAGIWSSQTEIVTFATDPAEAGNVDVYGVMIHVATTLVAFALFDAPVNWSQAAPLRIRVVYSQYAALTFKAIVLS